MLEKQETEFQPLTSISSRNVCRASELLRLGTTRYSCWPPRKGLGPPYHHPPPPPARHLSESRLFIRETALRNEAKGGVGNTRSKETSTIGGAVGPRTTLLSCWLVVSVEWRSYRLPWKESRARTPSLLLSPPRFLPFHPRFFRRPRPILQFPRLGYNLRWCALNHRSASHSVGPTLCR